MKKAKRVLRAVSCVFFGLLVLLFYLFPEYFIFAVGCYFDFELYQFVWIDSSDGVFAKKEKYVREEKNLPCPDTEGLALCFFVKSLLYEDESYNVPVICKRDSAFSRN